MSGDELIAKFAAMTDAELMFAASDWIESVVMDHMDGGGQMPSEIEGKWLQLELFNRANKGAERFAPGASTGRELAKRRGYNP